MPSNSPKQSQAVTRTTPRKPARVVLPKAASKPVARKVEIKVNVNVDVRLHLIIWSLTTLVVAVAGAGIFSTGS